MTFFAHLEIAKNVENKYDFFKTLFSKVAAELIKIPESVVNPGKRRCLENFITRPDWVVMS